MKHNNVLPNQHFRKDWQFRVRVRLNQAARKEKRREVRKAKALAIAPRPAQGALRPSVRAPTQKYNVKLRAGRGFTLEELKEAGIKKLAARGLGIAVDYRRRNHSVESLQLNVARLKAYKARVVVAPKVGSVPQLKGVIAKVERKAPAVEAATLTKEMKEAQVVRLAKQAISTHKLEGKRRFKKEKEEKEDAPAAAEE